MAENNQEPWRPTMPERGSYQPPAPQPAQRPQYNSGTYMDNYNSANDAMRSAFAPRPSGPAPLSGAQQSTQRAMDRTAPPQTPQDALNYQFYGAEDAARRQEEMFGQMMEAFTQAQTQSSQAWSENQQRNEGTMREGLSEARQDYTTAQDRNQGIMERGAEAQQEEVAAARAQNAEMLRQSQATLTHMFNLVRQGGEGSLASATSGLGSQMASSYNQGRWNPTDSSQFYQGMRDAPFQGGQFYQGMMGQADPSSQYLGQMGQAAGNTQFDTPDYSAWGDPEAHRSQWYLPQPTMQTQTIGGSQPQAQPRQQGWDPMQFAADYTNARNGY